MRRFTCALAALLSLCNVVAAQELIEDTLVHNHQALVLPAQYRVPALEIRLFPDNSDGFNLQLRVENYQLESPEKAGNAPEDMAEGHAHLMINGKKRVRIYGEWLHVDSSRLQPGINQLTVTLNSHDHYSWVVGKQPVLATVFLDPDKQPPVQHNFASHPLKNP
ncbi:MAG: hypothetical protein AAGI24_16295 [Pseudomonadota bacterium]